MKFFRVFFKLFYGKPNDDEIVSWTLMLMFIPSILELLLHISIVNFFKETIYFCKFNLTVVVFFENAGCINNAIAFCYYFIHPAVCIFFIARILLDDKNSKQRFIFDYQEDKKTIKEGQKFLFLLFFFSCSIFLIIYLADPYNLPSIMIGNPKRYWTEFFMDFILLLGSYLITALFAIFLFTELMRINYVRKYKRNRIRKC